VSGRRRLWIGVAACLFLGSGAAVAANADVFSPSGSEGRSELSAPEPAASEERSDEGMAETDRPSVQEPPEES